MGYLTDILGGFDHWTAAAIAVVAVSIVGYIAWAEAKRSGKLSKTGAADMSNAGRRIDHAAPGPGDKVQ